MIENIADEFYNIYSLNYIYDDEMIEVLENKIFGHKLKNMIDWNDLWKESNLHKIGRKLFSNDNKFNYDDPFNFSNRKNYNKIDLNDLCYNIYYNDECLRKLLKNCGFLSDAENGQIISLYEIKERFEMECKYKYINDYEKRYKRVCKIVPKFELKANRLLGAIESALNNVWDVKFNINSPDLSVIGTNDDNNNNNNNNNSNDNEIENKLTFLSNISFFKEFDTCLIAAAYDSYIKGINMEGNKRSEKRLLLTSVYNLMKRKVFLDELVKNGLEILLYIGFDEDIYELIDVNNFFYKNYETLKLPNNLKLYRKQHWTEIRTEYENNKNNENESKQNTLRVKINEEFGKECKEDIEWIIKGMKTCQRNLFGIQSNFNLKWIEINKKKGICGLKIFIKYKECKIKRSEARQALRQAICNEYKEFLKIELNKKNNNNDDLDMNGNENGIGSNNNNNNNIGNNKTNTTTAALNDNNNGNIYEQGCLTKTNAPGMEIDSD